MAIPSSLLTEKNPRFWGEAPLWRDLMRFVRLLGQRRSIRWGHDRITKARRIKMELKTKQNNPEEANEALTSQACLLIGGERGRVLCSAAFQQVRLPSA